MLPDVLDVPAALGSDASLSILKERGVEDYEGYTENMEKLREGLAADNDELWAASLYAGWLHTLRPLLVPKGEGYPVFMQNDAWTKKNLECFAGSFAELKHDTILYSKQVIGLCRAGTACLRAVWQSCGYDGAGVEKIRNAFGGSGGKSFAPVADGRADGYHFE